VVGAHRPQVDLTGVDLGLELVDEAEARGEGRCPRLGDGQAGEERPAPDAERVRHRDRMAEGDERRVDPVLQRRPVANEAEPEAGPLALGPVRRVGQPDRRHELTPGELGENPGIDPVGLGRERGEALDLEGIGDLDVPTRELELVVDEPRPVHRLDCGSDLLAVATDAGDERPEGV
jgi:hypothetical protein